MPTQAKYDSAQPWIAKVQDLGVIHQLGRFSSEADALHAELHFKIMHGIPITTGRAAAEARRILASEQYQRVRMEMVRQADRYRDPQYAASKADLPATLNGQRKGLNKAIASVAKERAGRRQQNERAHRRLKATG